jgi:hypothetical protein
MHPIASEANDSKWPCQCDRRCSARGVRRADARRKCRSNADRVHCTHCPRERYLVVFTRCWRSHTTAGSLQQIVTAVPLTIQQLLGYAFAPIAFITGVPWGEAVQVGNLLGTRIVLNEFVGYIELGKIKALLSPKSFMISTYLLCGFGSLTSIAIMAGGVGALVPSRRAELAALGLKAVLIGVMSNILAASIAGVLF